MPTRTVLVVDDDSLLRWALGEKLGDSGYCVLQAGDGQKALELIQRERVDLALLDYSLPDMDGLSLLSNLRKLRPDCAAILMSGSSAPDLPTAAARLGVARVIGKPMDLDDLVGLVDRTLGSQLPELIG